VRARRHLRWTQQKVADLLGITRKAYQSYEEDRAAPSIRILPSIISTLQITNISAFLEDPNFDPGHQDRAYSVAYESNLERYYCSAPPRVQQLVDLALGIGTGPLAEAITT
jgi:DNA-binding XRE family transcriptional regulator